MSCYLCGNSVLTVVCSYDIADKYLDNLSHRTWRFCPLCELYEPSHSLDQAEIQNAYLKYRDKEMRGMTVKEDFERLNAIPFPESENKQRVIWLSQQIAHKRPKSMLDIGSGLGIFPYEMNKCINRIHCIEPEPESAKFIKEELQIECKAQFYEPGLFSRVDLVTLVHLLEHMQDPITFLQKIGEADLKNDGLLFIEVPDVRQFDYLDKDHDEFNSLHMFFFSVSTLDRVLRQSGFNPYLFQRVKYKERNLSRIRCLANVN